MGKPGVDNAAVVVLFCGQQNVVTIDKLGERIMAKYRASSSFSFC